MALLDDALALAASGFPVFPCLQSKRPATPHGFKDASTEPDTVRSLFSNGAPFLAVPTGEASGFDVLDIDPAHGGMDWEHIHRLPNTRIHRTLNGGFHYLFIHAPGVRNSASVIAEGIDIRGDGGYIVHPPSPGYTVIDDTEPAHWPNWLLALVLEREPPAPYKPNGHALEPISSRRLDAFVAALQRRVAASPPGGKHYQLRNAALSLGGIIDQAGISEDDAVQRLLTSLPQDVRDWANAEKTARWGIAKGRDKPIILEDRPLNGKPAPFGLAREMSSEEPQPSSDADNTVGPPAGEFLATPFNPELLANLEARKWVYGHFLIRRYLSVLGAPGGSGKTAYAMTVAVAVALGRALLRENVHEAGPVWIYNLEDPADELLRRIQAILLQHRIDPAELVGRLYLDSGRDRPLVIASVVAGTLIVEPLIDAMIAELKRRDIKLLVVDPFVKSHRLEENRNDQIDFAASAWSRVAAEADCSILVVHHFRKGGISGEADAFRGASALVDAARAAVSISVMSEKECERLGIEEEDRRFYMRVDNAKLNLAPPPTLAVWIKLNSVDLPNGDKVQAVSRWEPPSPWEGIPMSLVVKTLDDIHAGPGEGEQFTLRANSASKVRWAGTPLIENTGVTVGQAKDMLATWVREGVLSETLYDSPGRRKEVTGCSVSQERVVEMRRTIADHGEGWRE